MKKSHKLLSVIMAVIFCLAPLSLCSYAAGGKWVAAWGTSIVDGNIRVAGLKLQDIFPSNSTVRTELKLTTGGEKLRFRFSNEYGSDNISFTEVYAAKTVGSGKTQTDPATALPITFGGEKSVIIPPGKTIWSDEINMKTKALERISVSIFFEEATRLTSTGLSNARTFLSMKNVFGSSSQAASERLSLPSEVNIGSGTITYHTTPFLSEVDTYSKEKNPSAAVFIGDSTLVNDTYLHYAEKIVYSGHKNISVINEAVIGNKLMSDGTGIIGNLYGEALKKRFSRDALNITGVKYIFVKIGLNDIAHQFSKTLGKDTPKLSAKQIIKGYEELADRAHKEGIKIFFFTKSPWKGYERSFLGQKGDLAWNKTMQKMCDELDSWVKTTKKIDGFIDCSPLANPADEYALCPSFTPDGAHLTPIASIALADLIPLDFVGINAPKARTAAELYKVDPYKEKKQIINDMKNPPETTTEKETEEKEEPTEPPTVPVPTVPEEITSLPEQIIPPEYITVPVIGNDITPTSGEIGEEPSFDIEEMETEKIGNGKNIGFLLGLLTIALIAGAVIFVVLGRNREESY